MWEIWCGVNVRFDSMGWVVCVMPVMGLGSVSVDLVLEGWEACCC